ncbi:hypothetical protein Leryth_001298 [Lithospermum erythrorhizon]|nr:hypothetical protein Leryth_001298 [Lithospermum erythrorhizon]
MPSYSSHTEDKFFRWWRTIWSCLMHCLPIICTIDSIADAALTLVHNIIVRDTENSFALPAEFWDLQLFKRCPSISILRFLVSYFSRRAPQGDLTHALNLRRNLLRAVLPLLHLKEHHKLDEYLIAWLPSAIYALCAGYVPSGDSGPKDVDIWMAGEEWELEILPDAFECSIEVLAKIDHGPATQTAINESSHHLRLPRQLKVELCHEVEAYIIEAIQDFEIDTMLGSDIVFTCALFSNIIYCYRVTCLGEKDSSFTSKICQHMSRLLNVSASIMQRTGDDSGCAFMASKLTPNCWHSLAVAFKCFLSSPLFSKEWNSESAIDIVFSRAILQCCETILKTLAGVFETCNDRGRVLDSVKNIPVSIDASVQDWGLVNNPMNEDRATFDVELDATEGSLDIGHSSRNSSSSKFGSSVSPKIHFISIISSFFAVLPRMTWDTLFFLIEKESDQRVLCHLLLHLCQNPYWSSCQRLSNLVSSLHTVSDTMENIKFQSLNLIAAISSLLQSLLSLDTTSGERKIASSGDTVNDQILVSLGKLVKTIAEDRCYDWLDRVRVVDCICTFLPLKAEIGQSMIEKLLMMLRDSDYRVRFYLAQKIGILFQTWDGHEGLFLDICENFGLKIVYSMQNELVTEKEVIAAGPAPHLLLETSVITLMYIAFHSENIELQAVFSICAVAAIDPSHRELVGALLDSLSMKLQYTTRAKYMEELMGPIIFCWVACGVSLVALLEIRDLLGLNVDAKTFMQYCCTWLLPALIINEDTSNVDWVSKIAGQPAALLVKNHFVHIFSTCMALHCSKKDGWEKGSAVLGSSILKFTSITETERDKLIKKHMVAIINHVLSLSSGDLDPLIPSFPKDTIAHCIRTIVDGFLALDDHAQSPVVIDKINIFRPDRVFMFIMEMHYKVIRAAHYRHRCNRLAAVEVLIVILGHRVAVPSTFNYLLNLVCQFIDADTSLRQSCDVLSSLLKIFKEHPSAEITTILGEQLQFLVPTLVTYCTSSERKGELSIRKSSKVVSLLKHLIMGVDPSVHEYIKELNPFPESQIFEDLRVFHEEVCQNYSPKNHILSLTKRSQFLPPRLLFWSLKALHKKLFSTDRPGDNKSGHVFESRVWQFDPEIVDAVWNLVHLCSFTHQDDSFALLSDFVSRVGVGDPHSVVFHLPRLTRYMHEQGGASSADGVADHRFHMDTCISEEQLVSLLGFLKTYLMDDSVKIIDMASQALRGILSTKKGQRAMLVFDSHQRSLIEVHSKGVNIEKMQKYSSDLEKKFTARDISVEMTPLWSAVDKTFEMWICPLVNALIGYCDDIILRLCQDIVSVKAEVAELLFPVILLNLSGQKSVDQDLCMLISSRVQENIFIESNKLMRSIQVILDALNALRLFHVMEKANLSSNASKRETSKNPRTSGSVAKSRSPSLKLKDHSKTTSALLWDKVYWLQIDYLMVAKAAIKCGSYFTAVMYVEHWCEENFKCLTLGSPDMSHHEVLPPQVEILASAVTQINESDSLYGIIQSHKLASQIVTFEHEGNWTRALEYYDLLVRSDQNMTVGDSSMNAARDDSFEEFDTCNSGAGDAMPRNLFQGLIRSLQQIGCTHVLDVYCRGLSSQYAWVQQDLKFTELQYEAAWRAGKWDFSLLQDGVGCTYVSSQHTRGSHFNENLHSCLKALVEGELYDFQAKLKNTKQDLLLSIGHTSNESTEYIYSTIIRLQIFHHLGKAWDLRWKSSNDLIESHKTSRLFCEPVVPSKDQLSWLNMDWNRILERTQLHMNLLEPFIAFRRILLQILNCKECVMQHLLQSASTLRKGSQISQAAAALHEFKILCTGTGNEHSSFYWLGRLQEARLLRTQGQHKMAINLAEYILRNYPPNEDASDVFRLVGKWLADTRSSNSRTIMEQYLKHAVTLADNHAAKDEEVSVRRSKMHFHLAHYADALFRSYEERLNSSEWQAAMRLRKHKTKELEALIRRLRNLSKGQQIDYSVKIQELQKQLAMDKQEAERLQEDRDKFLCTALEGYTRCLVLGHKYDVRVVFRLVSLWFGLSSTSIVVDGMLSATEEVPSYKFIPLVYQIASRLSGPRNAHEPRSFQFALVSLVKKMSIDHPYHTIFQLLALANGDRIKDKQRSKNSFVVDLDKKVAAENLLKELLQYHEAVIRQMRQMVELYIKLAELETKKEDTNKRITLPRDIRSVRELELVPVVTSSFPVDPSCQYEQGSFPHFRGLSDSVTIMNGINAPKVVECLGSDGNRYRQLAKSGNDDLRQDAVMEQFFGLVNTFLQNHRDTWKRRLRVRTYKVVPFTPSAGVLEWVNGTLPLGEYLIGSARNGGAHGRYGVGDWIFLKCRQHMTMEPDKRKAFQEVSENFRPVMHYFFLERFLHPADWFDKRLAYTRSVAASSMVGYIVGLGDRHSMNILIDQTTAEVVHIDLGVAFEQGLMLKTPERVPFRLTRDIIDGMGVTGVEGVFRRCCEETLSVMRMNKEALLTIVEVFIHDPLYKWALSPLKALQRQKETEYELGTTLEGSDEEEEYEGNKDAARALMRVKQKLDGYEEGEMRSVHGQVQQLIQDATDSDRLCHMFPGWGAWL